MGGAGAGPDGFMSSGGCGAGIDGAGYDGAGVNLSLSVFIFFSFKSVKR